eukprot:6865286-Prymnesium_polylepis.1
MAFGLLYDANTTFAPHKDTHLLVSHHKGVTPGPPQTPRSVNGNVHHVQLEAALLEERVERSVVPAYPAMKALTTFGVFSFG